MPRKPPADQPHLTVPKIEGQPYHPDPDVMAAAAIIADAATRQAGEKVAVADDDWENMTVEQRAIKVFGAEMAGQLAASPLSTHDINTMAENARAAAAAAPSAQAVFHDVYDDPRPAIERPSQVEIGLAAIDAAMNDETDDHTTNPYLLESSTILGELAYEAIRARAVIQQLDAEIDHLNQDAAFQIQRIEARRDIELEQRNRRKDDLMKIVSADIMLNGEKQGSDQ